MGKITTLEALEGYRKAWSERKRTVVWTNGCFDLLHAGHVRNLNEAKKQGDILVVGVNSDRSVRENKGPSRPVVPEAQRAEIVAALASVDYVVIFDDTTPLEVLRTLKPDVHCKGADYANGVKPMPEAELVRAYGGRIAFLDLQLSCSTTDLIAKIRQEETTPLAASSPSKDIFDSALRPETASIVDRLSSTHVLVIGDVMLDEYVIGEISRISPEAPVPVLDVIGRRYSAGGAANVAANISGLGASASLVGIVAEDIPGTMVRQQLLQNRVAIQGLVTSSSRPTTCKTRFVAGQQQIVRVDQERKTPLCVDDAREVIERVIEVMPLVDACVLSDYGKGMLTEQVCQHVVEVARRNNKPLIVDPKGRRFEKYRGCSVITPNLREAGVATGIDIECGHDLNLAANALMRMLPGTCVLITRGADGMTLFQESEEPMTIPTVARSVFDVVGAGDTAVATLAVAVAANFPMQAAMKLANIAAGIVVEKHGTVAIGIDELTARPETFHVLDVAALSFNHECTSHA